MELGLATFADLSSGVTPEQRMRELIEEAVLADQLGLDVFAIGEHHRPDFLISSPAIALAAVAADYHRAYQRHREVQGELEELTGRARERAQEAEDLRRGAAEIERLEPVAGEDVELRAEEERLANADGLHTAASAAHDALLGDPSSGSYDLPDASSLLVTASQALEAVAGHDPVLAGLAGRLSEAAYLISDIGAELASYVESVEADPARLAAVQQRRADLTRLALTAGLV